MVFEILPTGEMKEVQVLEGREDIIGRSLDLCLGGTPILHGTIEGYANGEFTVSCPLIDTKTGETRYAQVKIYPHDSPNDGDAIFSMTVRGQ